MKRFSPNYWVYWTAGVFWSLGLVAYFLVYNLYLLDLRFDEGFIGNVSAAFTLGSLTSTLPAAWLLNRFGMKRIIWASAFSTGILLIGRVTILSPTILQILAYANGATIGTWIVTCPPFISRSTQVQHRSWAFSLWHGTSIGMGVLGGFLVSAYSKQVEGIASSTAGFPLVEKKVILLCCAVVSLAACLIIPRVREEDLETHQPSPLHPLKLNWQTTLKSRGFVIRLILPLILWSLYVGSFPPFFNVFFYRHFHQSLTGIGLVFSASQLCQVLAIFLMPLLSSWLGQTKSIPLLQFMSAAVLSTMILAASAIWGAVLYVTYLSLQVMVEPALEAFIMGSVLAEERSLVSSVRYFILFLVQAAAVWMTGHAIRWVGYQSLLIWVSLVGMAAAVSFILLFGGAPTSSESPEPEPSDAEPVRSAQFDGNLVTCEER
ncbi:MAG TPA: MFS transporter [Terriglobia bacterium]|nr:MFS transporter [Terriglobia bacterium]